jgi:hypothetical protein
LLFPFIFEEQILYPFVYEYAKKTGNILFEGVKTCCESQTSYTLHAKSAYWSIFSVLSGYLSKKNYPTIPPSKVLGSLRA